MRAEPGQPVVPRWAAYGTKERASGEAGSSEGGRRGRRRERDALAKQLEEAEEGR